MSDFTPDDIDSLLSDDEPFKRAHQVASGSIKSFADDTFTNLAPLNVDTDLSAQAKIDKVKTALDYDGKEVSQEDFDEIISDDDGGLFASAVQKRGGTAGTSTKKPSVPPVQKSTSAPAASVPADSKAPAPAVSKTPVKANVPQISAYRTKPGSSNPARDEKPAGRRNPLAAFDDTESDFFGAPLTDGRKNPFAGGRLDVPDIGERSAPSAKTGGRGALGGRGVSSSTSQAALAASAASSLAAGTSRPGSAADPGETAMFLAMAAESRAQKQRSAEGSVTGSVPGAALEGSVAQGSSPAPARAAVRASVPRPDETAAFLAAAASRSSVPLRFVRDAPAAGSAVQAGTAASAVNAGLPSSSSARPYSASRAAASLTSPSSSASSPSETAVFLAAAASRDKQSAAASGVAQVGSGFASAPSTMASTPARSSAANASTTASLAGARPSAQGASASTRQTSPSVGGVRQIASPRSAQNLPTMSTSSSIPPVPPSGIGNTASTPNPYGKKGKKARGKGQQGQKGKRGAAGVISTILIVVGVLLLLTAAGLFIYTQLGYQAAKQSYDEVAQKYTKVADTSANSVPTVDFDALAKVNPDVVGWIYVPGTVINYPVVKTDNNTKYLRVMFDGTNNGNGAIFMDMDDTAPGMVDQQTTIYGHHMYDKSMFNIIDKTTDQAVFDTFTKVYYITRDATYTFTPLFTAQVPDTYGDARTPNFEDEAAFQTYLSDMLKQAKAKASDAETRVQSAKQVITLVTCAGEIIPRTTRAAMVCTVDTTASNQNGTTQDTATATATQEATDAAAAAAGTQG